MTDNEIINALECCSKITFSCDGCPLKHLKYSECYELVIRSTLDLINRHKSKLKALQMDKEQLESDVINANMNYEHIKNIWESDYQKLSEVIQKWKDQYKRLVIQEEDIKAEAVKEFAEELIYKIVNTPTKFESTYYMYREGIAFRQNEIIDIIKEMAGEIDV